MENELQKNFKFRGFRFTQIERTKDFALYLQENDVPTDSKEYFFYYEVIKIKKQNEHSTLIEGKPVFYPAKEIYPNDKSWGHSGWTFKHFNEAKAYYIKLVEKVSHSSQGKAKTENLEVSLSVN